MLDTKFRGNRFVGSRTKISKGYLPCICSWRPSLSCDPDAANKLSSPLSMEAQHRIWLRFAKRFRGRRCLKNVNGRTFNV